MPTPASEVFAEALAIAAREAFDRINGDLIAVRSIYGHSCAMSLAGRSINALLLWSHLWREHDRLLARIPGPLAEC